MPIVPLEGFGKGGLISDLPRESLGMQFFDECLNMKSKYGSITGVPDFVQESGGRLRLYSDSGDGAGYSTNLAIKPAEITQWTRSGDEFLDVLTLGFTSGGTGSIYLTGGDTLTGGLSKVEPLTSQYSFSYSTTQKLSSFIFNEMAIVNLPSAPPQFSGDKSSFTRIPNWLSEAYGSAISTTVSGEAYEVQSVIITDWTPVGGPSAVVVGTKFDSTFSGDVSSYGTVKDTQPYYAERMSSFNGRLIALNLYNDLGDGVGSNDIRSSISLAFSSSITSRNSLSGVEWYASSVNSAGEVLLTETSGRIVDAVQLGDYLMAYKTDSVLRYFDTGSPFFLTGETIFLDDGVMSERCVVDMGGNKHFVVGNYGLYMHTGGPESVVVSDKKVEKAFFNDLPKEAEDRALTFAFHDTLAKEIWVCYRDKSQSTSDTDKGCTRAMVFDYIEGTFHKRTLPNVNDIIETEVNGKPEIIAASLDVVAGSSSAGSLSILNKTTDTGAVGSYEADGFIRWNSRTLDSVDTLKELNGIYPTSENSFNVKVFTDNVPTVHDMSTEDNCLFDPLLDYKVDFREAGRYYTLEFNMNGTVSPELSEVKVDMETGGFK